MSVVVRMEMPQGCEDCPFRDILLCCCARGRKYVGSSPVRPNGCPIICSLPEGHGRLADKDLLMRDLDFLNTFGTPDDGKELSYEDILVTIDDFPTIVPAEAERSEA